MAVSIDPVSGALRLAEGLLVFTFTQDHNSYLLVRGGRSILIDCHSSHMRRTIESRGLPIPELILHTHVQPEHCREGATFPEAKVLVNEAAATLAFDRNAYENRVKTWENPAEWGNTAGEEPFGVAGALTLFPPDEAIPRGGTFKPGESLAWNGLRIEVVALPLHTKHAVGFRVREDREGAKPLALFSGDLFRDGPCLVNAYDTEIAYGRTLMWRGMKVLRHAAKLKTQLFLPSTGRAIFNGPEQAKLLASRLRAYFASLKWRSGRFKKMREIKGHPRVGRYFRRAEGVYQMDNFGNCIVFIDGQGRGLMVDPGPCDYENPRRERAFHADLDALEREAGLRFIDTVLVTHFHGDHVDLIPSLLRRYPACRVAAWDLVARVIQAPWDFPYSCTLPWYGLGLDAVPVHVVLRRDEPFHWHDVRIDTVHLPGHCHAHGGHLLTFNGKRFAITGDTIQSRGWADSLGFIISNHSVPDAESGVRAAYETMARQRVDMNLGGHGSCFVNCKALYDESVRKIRHAEPHLRALFAGGDLAAAFLRPTFPRMLPIDGDAAQRGKRSTRG